MPLPPGVRSHYKKHDPFGGTPFGATKTTDLIFEALENGDGFLDESLLYLTRKVRRAGDYRHGVIALSYLQGLYMGARDHSFVQTHKQRMDMAHRKMFNPHTWEEELFARSFTEKGKPYLSVRKTVIEEALRHGKGDPTKALEYLKKTRLKDSKYKGEAKQSDDLSTWMAEDHIGWGAYYYLMGLKAYPEFDKGAEKK